MSELETHPAIEFYLDICSKPDVIEQQIGLALFEVNTVLLNLEKKITELEIKPKLEDLRKIAIETAIHLDVLESPEHIIGFKLGVETVCSSLLHLGIME